jgi:hypothetical protein
MLHPYYDCIVVGAGISGLYMTRELQKQNPSWSIALAERYKGLGGRTYTYEPPGFANIHWEMGAGRIHKSHTLVKGLLKDYGLTWIPIGSKVSYKEASYTPVEPNTFETQTVPLYLEPLMKLDPSVLASHTIEELLIKLHGVSKTKKLLGAFPYKAEVSVLRADLGLKSFLGGEMSSNDGYGVILEGFSELVASLREDIELRGCTILNRHMLVDLRASESGSTDLTFKFGYDEGTIQLRAEKAVVLALHKDAVAALPAFHGWPTLRLLKTEPLLRTYMVFPVRNGRSWFSDLGHLVTPKRPRNIIPIQPKAGVIMISYTEGSDTKPYMGCKTDKAMQDAILRDIRALFPDRTIPDPLFFKSHPWTTGTTYWLPSAGSKYDPETESHASIKPLPSELPNVWLTGESWCLRQAWVEGALEQSILCLKAMKGTLE